MGEGNRKIEFILAEEHSSVNGNTMLRLLEISGKKDKRQRRNLYQTLIKRNGPATKSSWVLDW